MPNPKYENKGFFKVFNFKRLKLVSEETKKGSYIW